MIHLANVAKSGGGQPGGPDTCPFNPNHVDAASVNDEL